MKVQVYFNLHKKCFSIKSMENPTKGRVIAHADYVYLENVMLKVSEAGRQRVLRERRKNVHADIRGTLREFQGVLTANVCPSISIWQRPHVPDHRNASCKLITYDPYKYDSVVYIDDKSPIYSCEYVLMYNTDSIKGCYSYNA